MATVLALLLGSGSSQPVEPVETFGHLVKCPTVHPLDPHPCATCVSNNGQDGADMCAWCYSSKMCLPIHLGNPCPENADFSLFGNDCDCRPGRHTNCASCTKQPGCVWIDNGQKNWTVSVAGIGLPTFATDIGQTCVRGSPVGPAHEAGVYDVNMAQVNVFGVRMRPDIQSWCWGQCTISGIWFLVALVIGSIVAVSIIAGLGRCTCRRMQRWCCPRRSPSPGITLHISVDDHLGAYQHLGSQDQGETRRTPTTG